MINWYYVQGSERMGPVTEEFLNQLFQKTEINEETYIWKKGFKNWEKLKDVSELHFTKKVPAKKEVTKEITKEIKQKALKEIKEEVSIPQKKLHFNWESTSETDEVFFIKIGADRRMNTESSLFGPYSLKELREAMQDKRINERTLLFSAGMPGWIEVGQSPLNPEKEVTNLFLVKDPAPLMIIIDHWPREIAALVTHPGIKECSLLGISPSQIGKDMLCSLYSGTELKAKEVKIKIEKYNPKKQEVSCKIIEMSIDAQKVMQNYAE